MKTPKPPSDLREAGSKYWKVISRAWRLDPHQPEVLAQACRCLDVIAAAEVELQRDGPIVHDRFGQAKPHPASLVIRDYRGLFARMVRELGLSGAVEETRPPGLRNRYSGRA